MKVTIDTKEDSTEDIKKVIRMLQHVVGEDLVLQNESTATLDPVQTPQLQETVSNDSSNKAPMDSLFATNEIMSNAPEEKSNSVQESTIVAAAQQSVSTVKAESNNSETEDLFAELFTEAELAKMNMSLKQQQKEEAQEEILPAKSPYKIEFY